LVYWADEKDFINKRRPKGVIELAECSLATAEQHTRRLNTIGIFHPQRREYFLEAPSRPVLLEWVKRIEGFLGVGEEGVAISDFECLSIVGKGAYGKVLQVRKVDTGKIYAMKIITKDSLKSKERNRAEFERELQERENLRGIINVDKSVYKRWLVQSTKAERRVLEVVNHPFIVKLHYAFQTADRLCLVMDFINGGELFSYIAREKVFSEPRARFYAAEIILALEYLHEMSIIYRDLKPENILLDDKGHIRLTDFGHSKDEHSRNDRAFSMVGSPYYMAPEILLNKGHGKEADWWSLGILVYEMLVGLPPFYQENTKKAYEALLTKPLEFPENISREAKSMIRGLLHVDSSKRLGIGQLDKDINAGDEATRIAMKWKDVEWLKPVRWQRLLSMEEDPPFKPRVRDIYDISNFSSNFTSEVMDYLRSDEDASGGSKQDIFSDFQYVAPVWSMLTTEGTPSKKTTPTVKEGEKFLEGDEQRGVGEQETSKRALDHRRPPKLDIGQAAVQFRGNVHVLEKEEEKTSVKEALLLRTDKDDNKEDVHFCQLSTGREAMAEVPRSVSEKLSKLEQRNKTLQLLRNKNESDPAFSSSVALASRLCSNCKWDMKLLSKLLCDAIAQRDSIEECFTPKGMPSVMKQQKRLEELNTAFNKFMLIIAGKRHSYSFPLLLSANSSDGERSRVSSGHARIRTSSQGSRGSGGALDAFDFEAQAVVKELAAQQAELEADAARRKFELPEETKKREMVDKAGEEQEKDRLFPLPSAMAVGKKASSKRNQTRVHSENDLALWLKQQAELVSSGAMGDETASREEHEHATIGTSKEDRKLEG